MDALRLGHIHLKVRDADRSADFYKRLLGLTQTERHGNFIFLGNGQDHHVIALQGLGAHAPQPPRGSLGLYHSAFEVPDESEFEQAYLRAKELAPHVTVVDHGISWAMYFDDPDGNGVEIYQDRRTMPGGRPFWNGDQQLIGLD